SDAANVLYGFKIEITVLGIDERPVVTSSHEQPRNLGRPEMPEVRAEPELAGLERVPDLVFAHLRRISGAGKAGPPVIRSARFSITSARIPMLRSTAIALFTGLLAGLTPAIAQTPSQSAAPTAAATPAPAARPRRPPAPTRDPHTPGYVTAKELPDGEVPAPDVDGNFIIGPTHNPAPEMAVKEGVPQGAVYEFTMESKDSK